MATPHLGYMKKGSKLIDAGLWFIKRYSESKSLNQLTFADTPDIRSSALYDLSQVDGFQHFRHVFLVCSKQDSYVHFDSARIEVAQSAAKSKNAEIYIEMTKNLLRRLENTRLHKLDVRFFLEGNSFDQFIGRSAHMMYLENTCFMNTVKFKYWNELFS